MITNMNSSYFRCFNFKGNRLYSVVENVTFFTVDMITYVHFKFLTSEEVIEGKDPAIYKFLLDFTANSSYHVLTFMVPMSKFVLKDQLSINYEPEIMTGIGSSGFKRLGLTRYNDRPRLNESVAFFDISRSVGGLNNME